MVLYSISSSVIEQGLLTFSNGLFETQTIRAPSPLYLEHVVGLLYSSMAGNGRALPRDPGTDLLDCGTQLQESLDVSSKFSRIGLRR